VTGPDLVCVLTTIQPPTACARHLAQVLAESNARLLVLGDRKGPASFDLQPAEFFPLVAQQQQPFHLAQLLPANHYARKNLGYLLAVSRGAGCIYETDDDNMPGPDWKPRRLVARAQPVTPRPWMNVYVCFSDQLIWPRGFPLELINDPASGQHDPDTAVVDVEAPIQQGLADLAPDVDAVWRLVLDREVYFRPGPSLHLPPGTWCPFNSQSTWWWPPAYPLLYLPSYCSFRLTDIWRGFIAQRCLWELGHGLVFHGPEAIQERNQHNLLHDFRDEVPGYLKNAEIARRLSGLRLTGGAGAVGDNLVRCYEDLARAGFFPSEELLLVRAWVDDLAALPVPYSGQAQPARAA
jgi:STELLO glycosyltransferases